MKLLAPTLESAKIARRVRKQTDETQPQPVDPNGVTPRLWSACTGYVIDDDPAITVNDQDLVTAIAAAPGKIRPQDDTPAKARARLSAEIAKAKADREAGGGIVEHRLPLDAGQEPLRPR